MNNHEYPWFMGDNQLYMQNAMQGLPQLSTPKIISCI